MMERLTEWKDDKKLLAKTKFSGDFGSANVLGRLAEYEDLEEQGLLLRLPCKIGTKVYNITWWDDVQEKVVVKGKTYYRTIHKHKVSKSTFGYTDIKEIGKTVFLTKSEAEKKLKEMESK